MQWSHTSGGHSWQAPKLKLEVPIVPRLLEVKLSNRYRIDNHRGSPSVAGWGDAEAELKWAPLSQRAGSPVDLAIEPQLYLPTGDAWRGLGAGATRLGLPIMAARRFGPVQITGEAEYVYGFGSLPNALAGGVLGTWRARPRLVLGTEVYVERTLASAEPMDIETNVGFKWEATSNWEIDALVGRQLNHPQHHIKLVVEYAF